MKKLLAVVILCLPALGQVVYSGAGQYSGSAVQGGASMAVAFAQPPQLWVHNAIYPDTQASPICDLSSFTMDGTLGTGVYASYPVTLAGLRSAIALWSGASSERIKIPAGSLIGGGGTSETAYAVDPVTSNRALVDFPVHTATSSSCLVLESDHPPTRGQTLCSHGLPGFGGTRNPGCTNDLSHLWTIRQDDNPGNVGYSALYFPPGSNHIIVRDFEATILPGSSQSTGGHGRVPVLADTYDAASQTPPAFDIGIEYFYVHGWDPGDTATARGWDGQPTGACSKWTLSGTLTGDGSDGVATWASGNRFGMTFSDGTTAHNYGQAINQATVILDGTGTPPCTGGTSYTVTSHDPADTTACGSNYCGDTVMTLSSTISSGTHNFCVSNPPPQYANGCGDDIGNAIQWYCDNCWVMWGYIEKKHYTGSEDHTLIAGYSNGPVKVAHNWSEAGECGFFTGGGAVDNRSGPFSNVEVRDNYWGRDLNYKYLTGNTGQSPAPPFGCGPLKSGQYGKDNCPMSWGVKNSFETKFGYNMLIDGNIIENDWADAQTGSVLLADPRAGGGGTVVGVYDASGLPREGLKNIIYSNNWIRNSPQGAAMASRGGSKSAGNGVTPRVENWDWHNNLFTNIADTVQWGNPGNDLLSWGSGIQTYLCTMTRTSNVAHAHCGIGSFIGPAITNVITINSITRTGTPGSTGGIVTITFSSRKDPFVGGNIVLTLASDSGCDNTAVPCFNGTFTITGSKNGSSATVCNSDPPTPPSNLPCVGSVHDLPNFPGTAGNNGLWADTLVYADNVHPNIAATDTLCSSSGTACDNSFLGTETNSGPISVQTHAYRITDISPGDTVVIFNGYTPNGNGVHTPPMGCTGGDTTYNTTGLTSYSSNYTDHIPVAGCAAGGSPCTDPAGLDVYYPNSGADDSSGAIQCYLDNIGGNPKTTSYTNNTAISPGVFSIHNWGFYTQEVNNRITDNIFVDTDTGSPLTSDVTCGNVLYEGSSSLNCWDPVTFTFGGNVLQGRSSSNWKTVGSKATANAFPSTASCSGGSPDPTCIGFSGFLNGAAFQTAPCANSSAPFNCPQMSLPWANNLTLSQLALSPSSSYSGKGVDTTAMSSAFTSTLYVCPAGLNCGSSGGPYKDAP